MNKIYYNYQGQEFTAQVVEKFANERITNIIITLNDGKQAFLKSVNNSESEGRQWIQELYTEHDVWPPDLIQALATGLETSVK